MKKVRIRDLGEGERVADAETLSLMLGVPVGTLQRWAQKHGWPRRHGTTSRGRRTEYSVPAAKATHKLVRGPVDVPARGEVTCGHVGDLSPSDGPP